MRIRHNIAAMNSKTKLSKHQGEGAVTLQRLSSGYRINRAADDAAGLGVSEKMRALITGTEQAEENVKDGISLLQTADGAMNEIHAILNRCVELGTQAANGIYSNAEREKMQEEIDQLTEEVQRIATNTNFNGIRLLQGDGAIINKGQVSVLGGLPAWVVTDGSINDGFMSSTHTTTESYVAPDNTTTNYPINHVSAEFDFSAYNGTAAQKSELKDNGFYFTCCTCSNHYSVQFTSGTGSSKETSGSHYIYKIGIDGINNSQDLVQAIINNMDAGNPNRHYTKMVQDPANPGKLIVYDDRSSDGNPTGTTGGSWPGWSNPGFNVTANPSRGMVGKGVAVDSSTVATIQADLVLQIGPMGRDSLKIKLPNAMVNAIKIENLSVMSVADAQNTITAVQKGIDYLSDERGRVGAYQNRLEYTYQVLNSSKENLQSAESQIRDADISLEMMDYMKQQILSQSASAMLSQANKQPEAILELLQ